VFALARHFMKETNYRLDSRTWLLFLRYSWPGNVRELRNVIGFGVTRMRIEDPDSFRPSSAPTVGTITTLDGGFAPLETEPETVRESKKVPIPFEFVRQPQTVGNSRRRDRMHFGTGGPSRSAFVTGSGATSTRIRESQKESRGLDARIAALLDISPVDLVRLRKQVPKTVNASTASEDESPRHRGRPHEPRLAVFE